MVNLPPYYPNLVGGQTFSTLANELILENLVLDSSFTSQLITDQSVTQGSTRSITLEAAKDSKVVVNYYPSILETFKFKYSRYVAFFLIALAVFGGLFKMFIK